MSNSKEEKQIENTVNLNLNYMYVMIAVPSLDFQRLLGIIKSSAC